jgi:PPM family protein phosphatase
LHWIMEKPVNLLAAARTHVGRIRTTNEDAYGLCLDAGVFAVCDGMGGAAAGEVASRIAVDTVVERLCQMNSHEDRLKEMEDAIDAANQLVHARSEKESALHGMGTTLVALSICNGHALIAHVGDSRCYLYRQGELIRETKDHSLVDEQVRLGQLTQDQADRSPLRNVITRAIGTQRSVSPEMLEMDLEKGDVLLLCSDGLTREVPDERIAGMLGEEGDLESLCERLVGAAIESGGRDNVTCVVVRTE